VSTPRPNLNLIRKQNLDLNLDTKKANPIPKLNIKWEILNLNLNTE